METGFLTIGCNWVIFSCQGVSCAYQNHLLLKVFLVDKKTPRALLGSSRSWVFLAPPICFKEVGENMWKSVGFGGFLVTGFTGFMTLGKGPLTTPTSLEALEMLLSLFWLSLEGFCLKLRHLCLSLCVNHASTKPLLLKYSFSKLQSIWPWHNKSVHLFCHVSETTKVPEEMCSFLPRPLICLGVLPHEIDQAAEERCDESTVKQTSSRYQEFGYYDFWMLIPTFHPRKGFAPIMRFWSGRFLRCSKLWWSENY